MKGVLMMEKKIIVEVVTDTTQSDKLICKDVIEGLNEKLLIVQKVNINNKDVYDYSKGGFIKEENNE